MEHSTLHALLLTGLIVALGGPVAVLWLFLPAARESITQTSDGGKLRDDMLRSAACWVVLGALAATFATCIDFFVQVAELQGRTVFGGADPAVVFRFATETIVGRLCLARMVLLILTACSTRLRGTWHWWLAGALAWGAVIVTSFVSHAAAQPAYRLVAVAGQVTHITTASLWIGILLHLLAARGALLSEASPGHIAFVASVVRKFSPLALTVTSLLGFTGVLAAYHNLVTAGALFTSPYGLTLIVKLVLMAPAIYAGYVNFRVIRPRLLAAARGSEPVDGTGIFRSFARMLELEVAAGLLVITVAGILGSVSPPGEDGSQQLNAVQRHVFLSPHAPNTSIHGWDAPDDPRGPTPGILRYSEFTHNCSGMAVILLGIAWLAQCMRGNIGEFGARLSAMVLIPFGCFVGIAANPELWVLHRVKASEALTNPILLEHQLGALLVFILAWLTWRDRRNPEEKRPLGHPLPVIMIAGSLLLLGHAHSTSSVPDDLTNLINVQHAVFGAFGLFAGVSRLLYLRGLIPVPIARYVWPCCVICLGLFMTFFYREIV